MILRLAQRIDTGAYSEVFRSADGERLFKLFINGKHPSNVSQGLTHPDHDGQRRRTFAAECEAYEIAMSHPRIRRHVPQFYGRVEVNDVVDQRGNSVANDYLLDCCYSLEYVSGNERKLGVYVGGEHPQHLAELLKDMDAAGIGYLLDASVLMPEDSESFQIIDFATREIEAPTY